MIYPFLRYFSINLLTLGIIFALMPACNDRSISGNRGIPLERESIHGISYVHFISTAQKVQ